MRQNKRPTVWIILGMGLLLLGYQNCGALVGEFEVATPKDQEGPGSPQEDASQVYSVNEWGEVMGCALRPEFPEEILTVTFYVNGEAGMGERLGDTQANISQPGSPCSGHRFKFFLPETYRDGKVHTLYAYAGSESPEGLIENKGHEFAAYNYSLAGEGFFTDEVLNEIQTSCMSCHDSEGINVADYERAFGLLLNPSPFKGGTATKNLLIETITMTGGRSHGGGQICTVAQPNSPCEKIQEWWQVEFGE